MKKQTQKEQRFAQGPTTQVWDLTLGILTPHSCTGPMDFPLSRAGGDGDGRAGEGSPCFPERLAALAYLLGSVPRQPGALLAGPEIGAQVPWGAETYWS